ncbi:MAG: LapA family protein [Bacteroidetes bacterium]|nr:LapA family protein [Bacteroidota bacterium]
MQKRDLVIIIFLSLLIVIFATQNAVKVTVYLWIVQFESPLSLIIIGSLVLGALVTWLSLLMELRKRKKKIDKKEQIIKELKEEINAKDSFNMDI